MRKLVRILAVAFLFVTFSCEKKAENSNEIALENSQPLDESKVELTKVEFDRVVHNFGKIKQGEVVKTQFTIKNVGDHDLYVLDAHGSCGCTVPEVTKEAIRPGETAPIDVKFDSNGKKGDLTKTINIRCNTENAIEQIKIKVSILAEESASLVNKKITKTLEN